MALSNLSGWNDPAAPASACGAGGVWPMREYFVFRWHITEDCDQRCKHCYIFSENDRKELDRMSWEQMQEVVGYESSCS